MKEIKPEDLKTGDVVWYTHQRIGENIDEEGLIVIDWTSFDGRWWSIRPVNMSGDPNNPTWIRRFHCIHPPYRFYKPEEEE